MQTGRTETRTVYFNFSTPPYLSSKILRGYQVHKALEKYGNKVADLDKYLPWKAAMDLLTIIRGLGEVPASSNAEPPLRRGLFTVRPLRRATYPPININSVHSAIGKDLGNTDPVRKTLITPEF